MKIAPGCRMVLRLGVVTLVVMLCVSPAEPQDPNLKPTYGSVKLKAGFEPDPYKKDLEAGGDVKTDKGDVTAYVAKAPDFQLNYEAGEYVLTIYAESKKDTTLLIRTPDNKWLANDDGIENTLHPLIKFEKPKSGRYDIWVGVLNKDDGTPKATLFITELKK